MASDSASEEPSRNIRSSSFESVFRDVSILVESYGWSRTIGRLRTVPGERSIWPGLDKYPINWKKHRPLQLFTSSLARADYDSLSGTLVGEKCHATDNGRQQNTRDWESHLESTSAMWRWR